MEYIASRTPRQIHICLSQGNKRYKRDIQQLAALHGRQLDIPNDTPAAEFSDDVDEVVSRRFEATARQRAKANA